MRVLVIEDDSTVSDLYREYLPGFGCEVILASSFDAAAAFCDDVGAFDAVLSDVNLREGRDRSGPVAVRQLRAAGFSGPVVFCSSAFDTERQVADLDAEVFSKSEFPELFARFAELSAST